MAYTDHTVLLTGKYRFYKLHAIPPDYLLNIYKNPSGCQDKLLVEYVQSNIEEIKTRPVTGKVILEETEVKPICTKTPYATKKLANEALKHIRNIDDGNKKPIRSYECDQCNQWHLTSIPYEVWKEKMESSKNRF
jgi:hypothetical protein